MAVYTSELDHSAPGESPGCASTGPPEDEAEKNSIRRSNQWSFSANRLQPPKSELEHIHYFCGNTEIAR